MTERTISAVELARRYRISEKVLRGKLREKWPWPRRKNDFWTFPVGSEQAALMEATAKRLTGS